MTDVNCSVDWLDALPIYQKRLVAELMTANSLEETTRKWLDAGVASDTASFGTANNEGQFYERFIQELHKLICSKAISEDETSAALLKDLRAGQTTAVAGLAAFLVPHLGASTVILVPAVALTLNVISRAGLNAWCAANAKDSGTGGSGGEESAGSGE